MANVFDQVPPPSQPSDPWASPAGRVWGYAGFWWRVLAWAIDNAILGFCTLLIDDLLGASPWRRLGIPSGGGSIVNISDTIDLTTRQASSLEWGHHLGLGWPDLIGLLLPVAYYAGLESSRWQATLGKRICRLRVTGLDGGRISLARALGRYFGKFLSALIFCIGFLMVAWTARKQGLHDLLAGTLVVRLRPPSDLVRFNPPG